jgi:predicted nucleotide-binding protein
MISRQNSATARRIRAMLVDVRRGGVMTKPSLFIGSSTEGLEFARAVRGLLANDVEVTIWNEGFFSLGNTFIETLVASLPRFDFAILVLTPDDLVNSHGADSLGPRDNVLFELGLFMGRLGRSRTFILHQTDSRVKIPSDLSGVTTATYEWPRDDRKYRSAVGSACDKIREVIRDLGFSEAKAAREISDIRTRQDELQKRQTEQQEYHQLFFAILSNILTLPEKHHLRTLYRLGNASFSEIPRSDIYVGRPELRDELFRLRRFGLVDEVPGQRVGLIYDGNEVNLADFLRLTPIGSNFVLALPMIESQ